MRTTATKSTRLLALAAAPAVVTALLTACSSGTGPAGDGGRETLTVAVPTVSPPYRASSQANNVLRVTSNVFDPLLFADPATGELSPALATAWEQVSPTELRLTIRQNVKFHDGSPMTAEDVAFTISEERLWGADAIEPSSLASTFSKVYVQDPETVVVRTKQPDAALLQRLASPIGFVVPRAILEKEGLDKFGLHPIGTGPYEIGSLNPGESVALTANSGYWGPEPSYKELNFQAVPEVSARTSGLATGEYDIITNVPPDQVGAIEGHGEQTASVQVNNIVSLAFMTAKSDSPIADPRIRQALRRSVDLDGIATALWGDGISVPNGFNLPIYEGFYDPLRSTPPARDLDESKRLLDEAGYNGQKITIGYITGYYTLLDQALEVMQQQWAEAGLNVALEGVADFTLLDFDELDAYATSSNISMPDPISPLWTDWLSPDSVYLATGRGKVSPELAGAARTLATSVFPEERKSAYADVMSLWDDELPALTVWQPIDIFGLTADVKGFQPDPRYWMRFAPSEA